MHAMVQNVTHALRSHIRAVRSVLSVGGEVGVGGGGGRTLRINDSDERLKF